MILPTKYSEILIFFAIMIENGTIPHKIYPKINTNIHMNSLSPIPKPPFGAVTIINTVIISIDKFGSSSDLNHDFLLISCCFEIKLYRSRQTDLRTPGRTSEAWSDPPAPSRTCRICTAELQQAWACRNWCRICPDFQRRMSKSMHRPFSGFLAPQLVQKLPVLVAPQEHFQPFAAA